MTTTNQAPKQITLIKSGRPITVWIKRETPKAVLVEGTASEAWFPKSAIDSDGNVADWFEARFELVHTFLWAVQVSPEKDLENHIRIERDLVAGAKRWQALESIAFANKDAAGLVKIVRELDRIWKEVDLVRRRIATLKNN